MSRRQIVERAEAFLSAQVGEPVSIAQLCQVAAVSERSLRNAFYAVRGMSPKRCAVRTRLAEVRRALTVANGTRGAVTTIATDYGFFELGRFASIYKSTFGESPSETLRGSAGGSLLNLRDRSANHDPRAMTRSRLKGQFPTNELYALAHAGEPQPALNTRSGLVESPA